MLVRAMRSEAVCLQPYEKVAYGDQEMNEPLLTISSEEQEFGENLTRTHQEHRQQHY